jgi:hypothetical protein
MNQKLSIYAHPTKKKKKQRERRPKLFENGFLDFLKNERGGREEKRSSPMAANRISEVKPKKKCSSNYRWNRSKTQASPKKKPPAQHT